MFDLAWSELIVIGLVAVLVLGPKELPQAMRTFAKALRKVRSLGAEFQGHFNEMVREAELDEVRKQVQKFSQTSLSEHVTKMIDPTGEVEKEVKSAFSDPAATPPDPAPAEQDAAPASGAPAQGDDSSGGTDPAPQPQQEGTTAEAAPSKPAAAP